MFLQRLGEHKDVVHIHNTEVVQKRSQHVIHEGLERRWYVYKSHRHDCIFVQTSLRPEGGVLLVPLLHSDVVEADRHVELCVPLGSG